VAELDHITVVAPDLATGVDWVRRTLGVAPQPGGAHPQMGTHNCLLRLGDDVFLEVIATDPGAPRPAHRRWFGLDDHDRLREYWQTGRRLTGYVARCSDLKAIVGARPTMFGAPMQISRGDRQWLFGVRADGALPREGALPSLMDWGARGSPAPSMPDLGLRLLSLVVEAPEPEHVSAELDAIGFGGMPDIRRADRVRLYAVIDTPAGVRLLT
jgi:hypothetical protein